MPALFTHHIFAEEVYKRLDKKIIDKIDKERIIYQTFSQSHDYLFYYNSLNIKKTKKINFLGKIGHRRKTQAYLINIIKLIKKYHLEQYQPDIAYLFGCITHYVLDSTCHPLIFYKTGIYDPKNKETKKYKGLHSVMERNIDSLYYKKYYKRDFINCNITKEIIKKPKLSVDLITLINMVYEETYNEKNVGLYIKKGISDSRRIYSIFINDKKGIKEKIYSFIDKINHHRHGYLYCYTTSFKPNKTYLNLEHKTWNHPCFKDQTYNYSFDDLFEQSINKCINIINNIYSVLYENKDINILYDLIPNISYSTGLLIDKGKINSNRKMQFFEF